MREAWGEKWCEDNDGLSVDRVFQLVELVAELVGHLRAAGNKRLFVTDTRFVRLRLDASDLGFERSWSDADEPVAHAQLVSEKRKGRLIKQYSARGPLVCEPVSIGEQLVVGGRDFKSIGKVGWASYTKTETSLEAQLQRLPERRVLRYETAAVAASWNCHAVLQLSSCVKTWRVCARSQLTSKVDEQWLALTCIDSAVHLTGGICYSVVHLVFAAANWLADWLMLLLLLIYFKDLFFLLIYLYLDLHTFKRPSLFFFLSLLLWPQSIIEQS